MSIQKTLNDLTIQSLPEINAIIKHAETFEANQMYNKTIKECLNSKTAIDDMSESE